METCLQPWQLCCHSSSMSYPGWWRGHQSPAGRLLDHLYEGTGDVQCWKQSAAVQQHEAGGSADCSGQKGWCPVWPLFKRMVSWNTKKKSHTKVKLWNQGYPKFKYVNRLNNLLYSQQTDTKTLVHSLNIIHLIGLPQSLILSDFKTKFVIMLHLFPFLFYCDSSFQMVSESQIVSTKYANHDPLISVIILVQVQNRMLCNFLQ